MTKDIIIKFLNNRCTEPELDEVIRWAGTREALTRESMLWGMDMGDLGKAEQDPGDEEKFTALFNRIEHRIDDGGRRYGKKKKLSYLTIFTRAAAILLLPIFSLLFYALSELKTESKRIYAALAIDTIEVIVPTGARTATRLPDGSEVFLNFDSRIKYPRVFSGESREVRLIGEGYFNVVSDPERPFVVKAGALNIKALGTAFNVVAYPDRHTVETALVSGKLVLEQDHKGGKKAAVEYMSPGQYICYDATSGVIDRKQGKIEQYIAWKDGRLVFEDATIVQVAEKLGRMFNVDIEIAPEAKGLTYSVTFVDESLSQILELMTIATPVRYEALTRKRMPDGTFSKQKIIISKKTRENSSKMNMPMN